MPRNYRTNRTRKTASRSYARFTKKPRRFTKTRSYRGRGKKMAMLRPVWQKAQTRSAFKVFKYNDTGFPLALNVGNSYKYNYTFRGNDLYDPDHTGAGVQPYGFDQYVNATGPFGKFVVYCSKIKVMFYGTTDSTNMKVFVIPTKQTALTNTDPSDLYQTLHSKSLSTLNKHGFTGAGTIKSFMRTKVILPDTLSTTNSGAYNSSPATSWYWQIYFDSSAMTHTIAAVFDVEIKYYAKVIAIDNMNES